MALFNYQSWLLFSHQEIGERKMVKNSIPRVISVLFLCAIFLATCALAQDIAPFNPSQLAKVGDEMRYGVYAIRKIGEGIYRLDNGPVHPPIGTPGALGVDFYLICGKTKALMIDSGNNYMDGNNQVPKRMNGAEELRAIVAGLAGKVPLEMAVTHMHADHNGMSGAFVNRGVAFWAGEGESSDMLKTQLNLDTSLYKFFKHGEKTFDLGGRVVETFLVRGHTNGGTVYFLRKERMLFTGDCFGNGEGLGMGRTADSLRNFAVDSQRLVDFILANFSPYDRYALQIYSGHAWENGNEGYQINRDPIDVGFLDWRFLQDMAACSNGIVKGLWLVEGSKLRFVETSADSRGGNSGRGAVAPGDKRGSFIYGIGSMMGSLQAAYEAAGIKMPQ
jgi:glyoxylase-like metal-dependent hydrolase (beta-lactamase superfamily II)